MSDELRLARHMTDEQLKKWARSVLLNWRSHILQPAELIDLIESLRRANESAAYWQKSWKIEHKSGSSDPIEPAAHESRHHGRGRHG